MGKYTMATLAEIADKMKALDPVVDRIVCRESVIEKFRKYLAEKFERKTYNVCGVKIDVIESDVMPEGKILLLDRDGNPLRVIDVSEKE